MSANKSVWSSFVLTCASQPLRPAIYSKRIDHPPHRRVRKGEIDDDMFHHAEHDAEERDGVGHAPNVGILRAAQCCTDDESEPKKGF
jgi:hypothetical protein